MILLKTKKLKDYLTFIRKTEEWLARQIFKKDGQHISKYYMSLIINNNCPISDNIKEQLIEITHLEFNDLFACTGSKNRADFYPPTGEIVYNNKLIPKSRYKSIIKKQLKD